MDSYIKEPLKILGLGDKEIKFMEVNFELGMTTINEVAKKSGLQRSTAYLIAQDLIEKGFIKEDMKNYKKRICPLEPSELLDLIKTNRRKLKRQEIELEKKLPILETIYNTSQIKPKVTVYEGKKGLMSVWKDILKAKSELLMWTNQETEKVVFSSRQHDEFIDQRVRKGIKARVLAVDNRLGKFLKEFENGKLRETRILPPGVTFSAETYIYDNKIAILDYNKDIIGVIIESEPIMLSQKAIFEMAWNYNILCR